MRIAIGLLFAMVSASQALIVSFGADVDRYHVNFNHDTLWPSGDPFFYPSGDPIPAFSATVLQLYPGITATVTIVYGPSIPDDPSSPLTYSITWTGPELWNGPPVLGNFTLTDGYDGSHGGGSGFAHRNEWYDIPGGDGFLYYGSEEVRIFGDGSSTFSGTFSYHRETDPNFKPVPDNGPTWLLASLGILSLFAVRRYASDARAGH